MSNVRLIFKNTSILTAGSILTRIIEFGILLLLTRYLSIDGVGLYISIFAYLGYISTFVDSGLVLILRRECAGDRENYPEYIGNSLSITLIGAIIVAVIGFIILKFSSYPDAVKGLYIFGIPTLIASSRYISLRKILEVMFIVDFKVHYNVIFILLDRILLLICILWFIRVSHSPVHAVWVTIGAEIISFSFLLVSYIKNFKVPKLKLQLARCKYLLSQSFPNLLTHISHVTIYRSGLIMVAALGTPADVAIYGIASRIPFIINFIPTAFIEPVSVILSKKYRLSTPVFFEVFASVSKYLFYMAFPFLFVLMLEADELIPILFSESYLPAIPIIRILLISEVFAWGLTGFVTGLLSGHQQVTNFYILGIGAFLCIMLNIALIPIWGAMGAAYSTLFGTTSYLISGLLLPSARPYTILMLKSMVRPGLSAMIMSVFIYFLNPNIIVGAIMGPLLFFGLLYFIRGFNQKDLAFLLEIFPNNKFLNYIKK